MIETVASTASTAVGAVVVALLANWAAFRRYRERTTNAMRAEAAKASEKVRVDALQSYLTDEQLQAEFRKEIREEMQRLRDKDDRRDLAYRKLEDENSDLRRQVAGLDIEVMRLRAQLEHQHAQTGGPVGVNPVQSTVTLNVP